MTRDKRTMRRFALLARMREAEHRSATTQATQAIATQNKQAALASRAKSLSQNYDQRRDAQTALDLATQKQALAHTRDLAHQTESQAKFAKSRAGELTLAERYARQRRDHVRDHYDGLARKAQLSAMQKEQLVAASSAQGSKGARGGSQATDQTA